MGTEQVVIQATEEEAGETKQQDADINAWPDDA